MARSARTIDPREGKILDGRYRLIRKLAEGSMGCVYLGERQGLKRKVAIKFLHTNVLENDDFKKRFEREARTMSKLSHPHCLDILDYGVADSPYLVMDYIDGVTLDSMLKKGPLSPSRAARITKQILSGLEHAHRRGIVHRDIKPTNIIVSHVDGIGDFANIIDFGLAALYQNGKAGGDLTRANIIVGTPSYMAPEQTRGEKVDATCDIYALGVILFQMLTGKRPFNTNDTRQMLDYHRHSPVPALSKAAKKPFSDILQDIVARAMSKRPTDRFQTASAFSVALDTVPENDRKQEPLPTVKRSSRLEEYLPPKRQTLVLGAASLLCIASAVLFIGSRRSEATPAPTVTQKAKISVATVEPLLKESRPRLIEAATPALPEIEPTPKAPSLEGEKKAILPQKRATPTTFEEAKKAFAKGEKKEAIKALQILSSQNPKKSIYQATLGHYHFEQSEFRRGLYRYRKALELNHRRYRSNRVLNKNLVRALGDKKSRAPAERIIKRTTKRSSTSALKRGVRIAKTSTHKKRLRKLLRDL